MSTLDAVVVGGSVAGHAAALALVRYVRGIRVARFGGSPAGDVTVVLWPRGVEALRELGVERVEHLGGPLRALRYRDASGSILSEVAVDDGRTRLVSRAAIARALAGVVQIEGTSDEVVGLAIDGREVHMRTKSGDERRARVIVGAAGLRDDPVRRLAFGPDRHIEPGTIVVGHSPAHDLDGWGSGGVVELIISMSAFIGILPSLNDDGSQRGVSWWLFVPGSPFGPFLSPGAIERAVQERVDRAFEEPVRSLVRASRAIYPMPVRTWLHPAMTAGASRIALVGDSFRAATPELGLGVTWALEDAIRLGECSRDRGLVPGFADYVRRSSSTTCESIFGRLLSHGVARADAYAMRRLALGEPSIMRAAVHLLSARR